MQEFGPAVAHRAPASVRSSRPARKRLHAPAVVAGRYQIVEWLGQGGMGTVYRAIQQGLDRHVAIKLLPRPRGPMDARQRDMERRFETEARFAAHLNHPHAVQIIDVGRDARHLFLAMEWVRGQSLHRLMRQARLPTDTALEVARQVASAVSAAHELGALHRDLKPGNIMMQGAHHGVAGPWGKPWAKLLDFGLAKPFGEAPADRTQLGRKLGSPGYMAPEQVLGQAVDARSDVYGLGAVLFEMLAGAPAFAGADARAVMQAHVDAQVPSLLQIQPTSSPRGLVQGLWPMLPSQAEGLESLVQTALHKDPDKRFATMGAMVAAIESVQRQFVGREPVCVSLGAQEPTMCLPHVPTPAPSFRRGSSDARSLPPPLPSACGSSETIGRPAPASRTTPWLLAMVGAAIGVVGGAASWHSPRWHIESLPREAAVYWNDTKVCEQTPCRVQWQSEDVGASGTLRLVRPGFDDVVQGRRIGRFNKTLAVTLEASER